MWRSVLAELRRAGPRKIAIVVVLGAIAVVFAWGNHTSDSAANGATLPRTAVVSTARHTMLAPVVGFGRPRVTLGTPRDTLATTAHVRDGVIGRYTP